MSRIPDNDPDYNNAYELWAHNARLALKGRRGRKALAGLRDALLALPEKRLIARALCTAGVPREIERRAGQASWLVEDLRHILETEGVGVCAVGAYVWWQKVKAGADPETAFAELPILADINHDSSETPEAGREAGLTITLAWELVYRNDETFQALTPEERYEHFLAWLDAELKEAA